MHTVLVFVGRTGWGPCAGGTMKTTASLIRFLDCSQDIALTCYPIGRSVLS